VLGVSSIIIYNIFTNVNTEIQGSEFSTEAKDQIQDQVDVFPRVWDSVFLIVFVGLTIALFISAFYLNSEPIFFIFAIIILAIAVVIAAVVGNLYENVVVDTVFTSSESNFTIIPFIMSNTTQIVVGLGFLLLIGLFAKSRSDVV
jgi:Ca2+/Na+ antiporter